MQALLEGGEPLWIGYDRAVLFTTVEPCPMCLGVADYLPEEEVFACRRCKARTPLKGFKPKSLAAARD